MKAVIEQHSPESLLALLGKVRKRTESLAGPLSAEDQTVQSMPNCSPTKWHRAHSTWFFETFILKEYESDYQVVDDRFAFLFNSYYVAAGPRYARNERGNLTRPGCAEIGRYRAAVDSRLEALIEQAPEAELAEIVKMVILGVNHEEQHQELLIADAKHLLSFGIGDTAYLKQPKPSSVDPGPVSWVDFEGGLIEVGHEGGGFHFDNELPRHQRIVEPFRLANRLVTVKEWLEFVDDGGYERPQLWLSDGWAVRQREGWDMPQYWSRNASNNIDIHSVYGTIEADLNEPVAHISYYEADAFASWARKRLPTEFEWEHAASDPRSADIDDLAGNFLESEQLHPNSQAVTTNPNGLAQQFGDCWEWTASSYSPYPGYRVPGGAIGEYNGKFMINTIVSRGGCAFTPRRHVRRTYRNFYHPNTRWHLSGLRLAE